MTVDPDRRQRVAASALMDNYTDIVQRKIWVIRSFRDETSADLFRDRNARAARRNPRDLWRLSSES
jgi:hypothetical protein